MVCTPTQAAAPPPALAHLIAAFFSPPPAFLLSSPPCNCIPLQAWRSTQFFDDVFKLVGVPVITVQLRYDGWVTEMQVGAAAGGVAAGGVAAGQLLLGAAGSIRGSPPASRLPPPPTTKDLNNRLAPLHCPKLLLTLPLPPPPAPLPCCLHFPLCRNRTLPG